VTPKQRPKLNNERPLIQAEGVEHRIFSFTDNVVYRQKLISPYKPKNSQASEGQTTIMLVLPWPKVYQRGVDFAGVG
jgi:hypothetical protein